MNDIKESIIASSLKRYGYQLKVFSNELEDDANDMIAHDFQDKANDLLEVYNSQQFPKYKRGLQVVLRFVEKANPKKRAGFDAMVVPLADTNKHTFGIFISMDLLRGLSDLFTALAVGPDKVILGVSEKDMEDKFEGEIYPRILAALIFMMFHEFAHILRVHIPYFYGDLYKSANQMALLSFHLVENYGINSLPKLRTHRAMEIDADLLAIGLILESVSNKDLDKAFLFPTNLLNDAAIIGESIYITMRMIELWRRQADSPAYHPEISTHPHPDIRQIFIDSWLMARAQNDTGKKFAFATGQFKKGTDLALEKMDMLGPAFLPRLDYLVKRGMDDSLEEYELLRLDLENILKPALSTFFAD